MAISNYNEQTTKNFIKYFKAKGMTDNGIAGLLGNIYSESKVYTNNLQNSYNTKLGMTDVQYTDRVNNGTYKDFCSDKAGYGLCQWTSAGRKTGLMNFKLVNGGSIDSEEVQFGYLWYELNNSYKKVLSELMSPTNTVASCAEIVVCKFEIPASVLNAATKQATIDKRAGFAQEFYDKYLKNTEVKPVATTNKVIALSAGHYLLTPGKRCMKSIDPNETREWVLNSRIADMVTGLLAGYNATIVRLDDPTGKTQVKLEQRAQKSDAAKADIYISIHHNAGANGSNSGGTVVYHSTKPERKVSATALYNEIVSRTGLKGNRSSGVKQTTTLYEVRKPKAPSFLIENGFMDSKIDTPIILTNEHAMKTAEGIVAFLIKELKLTKVSNNAAAATPVATPAPVQKTPIPAVETTPIALKEGDKITLVDGATYYNGKTIPSWVKKSTLYYRGTNKNGVVISTVKTGAITGTVNAECIKELGIKTPSAPNSYIVKITATSLNIRKGPSTTYAVAGSVKKGSSYTIVAEENGFGKLKSGAGWICLKYTERA